jgi:MFS family permease
MLELTNSALWVGLMAGAPTLPLLFLSLPAGAVADSLDRRRILVTSTALMVLVAVSTAALLGLNLLTPGLLLSLGILTGVGVAFFAPAWQALVPDIVPGHLVPDAISLNAASAAVAWAAGPALGGILVATVGPAWTFFASAAGYGTLLVVAITLRIRTDREEDAKQLLRTAVAAGLRYMRFSPAYRWLLVIAALFGFTSAALRALLPSITSEKLEGEAATYGLLLGMLGAGAMLGAFTRRRGSRTLLKAMIPLSVIGYGTAGLAISGATSTSLASVGLVVAGVLWTWILATLNATMQMLTPAWVRARAMSFYLLAFFGLVPLGSAAAGALGDLLGPSSALLACSAAVVLLGVVSWRLPVPMLENVAPPESAGWTAPRAATLTSQGRLIIETTWQLDAEDIGKALSRITLLRAVRLRTGASGWRLYRDVDDPNQLIELITFPRWEEYARLADRVDTEAAAIILHARGLDKSGKPQQRRLVELDVSEGADGFSDFDVSRGYRDG